jgi:hypothetical protein
MVFAEFVTEAYLRGLLAELIAQVIKNLVKDSRKSAAQAFYE